MIRYPDLETFAAAAAPRALVGPCWLHFQAHEGVFGVVLWGRPNAEETRALVRSLKIELVENVVPHRSLVDASRVDSVDGGAFDALNEYVREHESSLSRAVTKLALVRPPGLPGAVTSGFFEVVGSPYPVAIFDAATDALAWLEEPAVLGAELDTIVEDATGRSVLIARLRALLIGQLTDASLGAAAKRLGMSERTLQRRLSEEGTTFGAQLLDARLAEAQRRIRDSDEPLATIAQETGFSSQQHLSTAFRKATGEVPSVWRKRHT